MSRARWWGSATAWATVFVLAACSSTPAPRFHSLLSATGSASAPLGAASLAWQLAAVSIPAQVDQPQFVVRRTDDTLVVLEQERWIAPLQDEMRAALIEHLSATLGPPGAAARPGRQDWRVQLEVSRFDSSPGRTVLVVQWALSAAGAQTVLLRCVSRYEQTVPSGMVAVAEGHRQALRRLAGAIGPALQTADVSGPVACP